MNRKERIIDIKALLRCTLEKWRLLIIAGLICGAVMGGMEGYTQYKAYRKGQEAEAAQAEEAAASTASQGSASLKDQELKMINDRLEEKNRYYAESILGKIDPANEGFASADLIVDARPAQSADRVESDSEYNYIRSREFNILNYYTNAAMYSVDLTEAAEALGTKAQLLGELITVTDSNKSDAMITIRVIYPTEEGAKTILDSVVAQVSALHAEAQRTYGEHTFVIANEVSSTIVDTAMYKWSNNRAAEITALINSRKTLDKNLSSGTTTAKKAVTISKKSALKAAVKRGAIGLFAGIFGALALVALYLIVTGVVLSGRELNRQYSLRRIACIPGRKYGSLKGPDKWVASIDASYYNHPNRAICVQVANANLETLLGAAGRDAQVAMVGDLPNEYLEKAAAEFTKTAKASGSRVRYYAIPLSSQTPEGVEAIRRCDAAVLVAKAGRSTYKGVGDVLDTAELLGRDVAGSVVFV